MGWQCVRCGESIGEQFDACWNCGTGNNGERHSGFRHADQIAHETLVEKEQSRTALPAIKLQFSTRSLFVLTTMVAAACAIGLAAWLAWAQLILIGAVATVLIILLTGAVVHVVYGLGETIQRICRRK